MGHTNKDEQVGMIQVKKDNEVVREYPLIIANERKKKLQIFTLLWKTCHTKRLFILEIFTSKPTTSFVFMQENITYKKKMTQ